MLINPNLTEKSEFNRNSIVNYKNTLDIDFIDDNTIKIKKKEEVDYGFIYHDLFNQIEKGSKIAFTGELELISGPNVKLVFNGFNADSRNITRKGKNSIEAIGGKNNAVNQVQVRLYHNEEVIFKFVKMKLEEGDKATPYIPHKDLIDPSKQAIFLSGGYSKRCIQSKFKTSRNRPVKSGGALC